VVGSRQTDRRTDGQTYGRLGSVGSLTERCRPDATERQRLDSV
jgi:hypothetical protein